MSTLQEEIVNLKSEIEGYRIERIATTDNTEKASLLNAMTERGKTLNALLTQQQQQQQGGNPTASSAQDNATAILDKLRKLELSNEEFKQSNEEFKQSNAKLLKSVEEFKQSNEEIKRSIEFGFDRRLAYFADGVSGSSVKSREEREDLREYLGENYGGKCLFCGVDRFTCAHIVSDVKDEDYTNFGSYNGYVDELDSKSKRNFIPLCGTKGEAGTCHNEFDNFGITLLYNPLTKKYVKYCLNPDFKPNEHLHGKETEIVGEFPPYCRLLSWRSRTCAQRNQFFFGGDNDKRQAFLNACKISEVNSIKRGGDSSSSGSDNL